MPNDRKNTDVPKLKIDEASDISYFSVKLTAEVESSNGYEITAKGFIYGLDKDLRNTAGLDSISVPIDQDFFCIIEELRSNTRYYFKAYAENVKGRNYSNIDNFATWMETPTVVTENPKNVVDGNATLWGTITLEGTSPIEEQGICWSISSEDPEYNIDSTVIIPKGKDISITLKKMTGGISYSYRAFARNQSGLSYGRTVRIDAPKIWEELAPFPGGTRINPTTFTIFQNFYVAAGDNANTIPQKDLWEYSTATNTWEPKNNLTGVARKAPSSFVIGNKAYVGLGIDGSGGSSLNDFYYYQQNQSEWNLVEPEFEFEPRGYALSFSLNDVGYIVGGRVKIGLRYESLDEVLEYIPDTGGGVSSWKKKKDFPEPIYSGISFTSGGKAFVGLGIYIKPGVTIHHKKIWVYDSKNDNWEVFVTVEDDFDLADGGLTTATVMDDIAYIPDGKNLIWALDLKTKKWTKLSYLPPKEKYPNQCMFSKEHEIYIGLSQYSNTFYKYRLYWDNPLNP